MPYQPTTNFNDSNGVDLGKKLVTNDYLLEVYGSILNSIGNSGLTVTPSLWLWGQNSKSQLGINNPLAFTRITPVTTVLGGTNWKTVSGGYFNTMAIKTDGTLWIWGDASYGQLGINDNNQVRGYTPITTLLGGTNWNNVSGGGYYTAATKTDGTLWIWGRNDYGQLGGNDITSRSTPVTTLIGGTNWKTVSCGYYFAAAIKTDGTLWTWGENSYGQLGLNSNVHKSTPVTTLLGGTNWKSVSCGNQFTIATKTDGSLWIWGDNRYGQLGINNTISRSTPVTTLLGGTNWKSVLRGGFHTVAIKTDGTLWNWGRNDYGQLGVNDRTSRSTPVTTLLGGTNWKSVYGGGYHTVALKTDGSLWSWGQNQYGQLGINNTVTRSTPVTTLLGGTNWKSISSGGYHIVTIQSQSYI